MLHCEDQGRLDEKIALPYVDPFMIVAIVLDDKVNLIAFGAISPSTSSEPSRDLYHQVCGRTIFPPRENDAGAYKITKKKLNDHG